MRRCVLATLVLATVGVASAQDPYQAPYTDPPPPPPPLVPVPPPTYAPRNAPRTLDWEPGEPVPEGYHLTTQIRTGLVVGGAVVFGVTWFLNALVASIGIQAAPLYIPIVGPFIAMGTFRSLQAVDAFFLALDGLTQAGGVAMFIVGLAVPRQQLVRNRYATAPWILPMPMAFGNGGGGIGFVGMM